jgi:hypothetical protein
MDGLIFVLQVFAAAVILIVIVIPVGSAVLTTAVIFAIASITMVASIVGYLVTLPVAVAHDVWKGVRK